MARQRHNYVQPRSFILYRGPSLLDGEPIVAVGLMSKGSKSNEKTGNMLQTYILNDNGIRPGLNLRSGADVSICGDCRHRPANGGTCYVVVAQGPTIVWKQIQLGAYHTARSPADITALGEGRMVRLGTYGDPAAVPAFVWKALTRRASGRTGYTHQWRKSTALRDLVMASCDTPEERDLARSRGWRTFTVRTPDEPLAARESVCPASIEAGKKTQCIKCGLCNGAESGRKGSIAIIAHGRSKTLERYTVLRQLDRLIEEAA